MNFLLKKIALATGVCLLALVAFAQPKVKSGAYRLMLNKLLDHSVKEVGIQDFLRDSSHCVLLDAREPREFTVSHIAGAVQVGYDHFALENLPADLPKDQRVVVYCSVGYRSEKVAEKMQKAGFSNVSNLYGGIFEWVNQGMPVVDSNGISERVHAYDRLWGIWLKKGKKVY